MEWETGRYEKAILMTCCCLTAIESFRECFTKGSRQRADDSAVKLILWYETFLTYFRGESTSDQNTLSASTEVINQRLEWACQKFVSHFTSQPGRIANESNSFNQIEQVFLSATFEAVSQMSRLAYSQARDFLLHQGDLYQKLMPALIKDDWLKQRLSEGLPLVNGFYWELETSS